MEENEKARVLIVDDNLKNIQLLGTILSEEGYDVEIAQGGNESIELMEEVDVAFDILLLDIMMPIMDGYQVCEVVRKKPKYDNMPIIFLTARVDKESLVKGFKLGAQDYITKPFDSSELIARVKTHIDLKKHKEQLRSLNHSLEEKVNEATKDLNAANQELIDLSNTKDKFLNVIGRELREPLAQTQGILQLLKDSAESSKLVALINLLDDSVSRFELFSKMALQLTELKTGNFKTKDTDIYLKQVLEYCLIQYNDKIIEQEFVIRNNLDDQHFIYADQDLSLNLFIGILGFAFKEAKNGSKIVFESFLTEQNTILSIGAILNDLADSDGDQNSDDNILFKYYAEAVMKVYNGDFNIETKNNITYVSLVFLNKSVE